MFLAFKSKTLHLDNLKV